MQECSDICDEVIRNYILSDEIQVKLAHVISFGAIRRGVQFALIFEKVC